MARGLSATAARLALNERVVPYDLNTPLFSDYAHKLRTVWMPEGAGAKYQSAQSVRLPGRHHPQQDLLLPARRRRRWLSPAHLRSSRDYAGEGLDLQECRLIETRLLVRREHGWEALPYVWNAEQTDAELERTGDEVPLELVAADGDANHSPTSCPMRTSAPAATSPTSARRPEHRLGLKARHLNRDYGLRERNGKPACAPAKGRLPDRRCRR